MSYLGLQNYILTKAKSIARDASYETIITGVIKASAFSGYRVVLTHSNSEVNNVMALFSDDYQVGDRVYLIITELDVSESNQGGRYYILGKVSTIEKDYTSLTLEDRFEEVEKNGVVSLVFSDTDITNITDGAFLGTLNECSSMMLTGEFTFVGEIEEEYGIKMTIQYGENEIEEFLLTSSYFNGNPYIKGNTTYQKRIFATGVNPFRQITQVKAELVGENFTVNNLSLHAGNLLDVSKGLEIVIEPAAAGNKNYFLYNDANDTVKLKALFYNNSILLDEENIHYYWFIKDDSITEDSPNYFEKIGKGWKILNSFSIVNSIDEKGTFGKFDDYKSSTSIEIKVSDLSSGVYENSVVCYIVYNKCEIKSKNYSVYNLSAYNFSSTFVAKDKQGSTTNKILSADDELTLTFDVQGENQRGVSKAYSWQIGQEKIENYDKNFIKIIDKMNENNSNSLDSNENEVYVLNLNKYENKKINITCSVSVNAHGTTNVWNDSDSVEIESLIGRDKTNIIETKYINYYISERRNIIFTKDSEKISSSKTEISDNYWMTENENIFWINYSGEDISKDDSIFDNINENESYYLYVTTAEVSEVKNGDGTEEVVRIADWEYPIIKRKVRKENEILIEELSEEELKQLNTFNSLTGGGTEQGVYYSEGDHGDLYINAEYINTGTLRVGNEGDEIFYASIDNPEVKIAGFTVDQNSMESGIKDTADYVHVGTDGIQAGENFKVVNGEVTVVGNITVTGGKLQEELDSIKQGWVDRYYISTENHGVDWKTIVENGGFLTEEETFGTYDTDMTDGFDGWTGWSENGNLTYVWKISAAAATFDSTEDPGKNNCSIVLMPDLEAVSLAAKNQILNNKVFVYRGVVDRPTGTFGGLFATEVPEGDVGRWCIFYNRTVISGGAIVTGSIGADQIKVNDLEAVAATIGEWEIHKDALYANGVYLKAAGSDSEAGGETSASIKLIKNEPEKDEHGNLINPGVSTRIYRTGIFVGLESDTTIDKYGKNNHLTSITDGNGIKVTSLRENEDMGSSKIATSITGREVTTRALKDSINGATPEVLVADLVKCVAKYLDKTYGYRHRVKVDAKELKEENSNIDVNYLEVWFSFFEYTWKPFDKEEDSINSIEKLYDKVPFFDAVEGVAVIKNKGIHQIANFFKGNTKNTFGLRYYNLAEGGINNTSDFSLDNFKSVSITDSVIEFY